MGPREPPVRGAVDRREVSVKVLDIDRDRQRISLGLKQTQEDPWERVVRTYNVGDVLEGKVTKVVSFGAFVEIMEGVEGLVHISELAQHHVENPREVVEPEDHVKVKILEIDEERRRLSLSLKRVEGQVLPLPRAGAGRARRRRRGRGGEQDVRTWALSRRGRSRRRGAGRCRRGDEPRRRRAGAPSAQSRRERRAGGRRSRARGRGAGGAAAEAATSRHAELAESRRPRPSRRDRAAGRASRPDAVLFVGLTGGIGSGKSEALAAFERLGAADALDRRRRARPARLRRGSRRCSRERWGERVLADGEVDRAPWRAIVFERPERAAPGSRRTLFPRVGERMAAWRASSRPADAGARASWRCRCCSRPGIEGAFDATVAVVADEALRPSARAGTRATSGSRAAAAASSPRTRRPQRPTT